MGEDYCSKSRLPDMKNPRSALSRCDSRAPQLLQGQTRAVPRTLLAWIEFKIWLEITSLLNAGLLRGHHSFAQRASSIRLGCSL